MHTVNRFGDCRFFNVTRAVLLHTDNTMAGVGEIDPVEAVKRGQHVEGFATVHGIVRGPGGRAEIGEGELLDRTTLADLMGIASGSKVRTRRLIPQDLLCCDADRMVWHVPASRRPIWFSTGRPDFDQAVNGREVIHPPLLFVAEPETLIVLALASGERPTADTPVYRAPYLNLYERSTSFRDGLMCSGNVALPLHLDPDQRAEVWERAFFQTAFTHSNLFGSKITLHPGGHDGLWREMAERAARTEQDEPLHFPAEYLAPMHSLVPLNLLARAKGTEGAERKALTVGEVIAS